MKEQKKKPRNRNFNGTLSFLKKNNIQYIESKMPNIVIVNPTTDNVFLSLKKEDNLLKCRFKGNNKWYTYSKQRFIEKFS
jgi:hypothetical protein